MQRYCNPSLSQPGHKVLPTAKADFRCSPSSSADWAIDSDDAGGAGYGHIRAAATVCQ